MRAHVVVGDYPKIPKGKSRNPNHSPSVPVPPNRTRTVGLVMNELELVRALADENEELRRQQAEQRQTHIALLEGSREAQWRLEVAGHADAVCAPASTEWNDADVKLQLLLTENNILESRERQTLQELQAQQDATRQLQLALAEAQAAAERAHEELAAREELCRAERSRSEVADERKREADVRSVTSSSAVTNLQRELEAMREEVVRVHVEMAAVRHESEHWQVQLTAHKVEATRREQEATTASVEAKHRLNKYRDRVRQLEADMGATERTTHQNLATADAVRSELVATQRGERRLDAALSEAHVSLQRAAEREAALQAFRCTRVLACRGGGCEGRGGGFTEGACHTCRQRVSGSIYPWLVCRSSPIPLPLANKRLPPI
jgi:chromosome segregation ATPase